MERRTPFCDTCQRNLSALKCPTIQVNSLLPAYSIHSLILCFALKIVNSLSVFPSVEHEKPADSKEKTKTGKEYKPLTGTEVVEILAKKKHLGEREFYYLKASEDGPYRCQS